MRTRKPPETARVLVDGAIVGSIGVAICLGGQQLPFMTGLVALVFVVRVSLARQLGGSIGRELVFLGICTAVGAANDWNTVVLHDVYAYDVPSALPVDGAIPVWMLLYWGLILRFVSSLGRWPGLGDEGPSDQVGFPKHRRAHPLGRLAVQLVLVLATRQAIYRFFDDPLLSWLPFAGAAALWWLLLGLSAHDRRLALLAVTVGTASEAVLITVGGLHRYELGLIGGVPLWIILWWPLAVLVWKDIGGRIEAALSSASAAPEQSGREHEEQPAVGGALATR